MHGAPPQVKAGAPDGRVELSVWPNAGSDLLEAPATTIGLPAHIPRTLKQAIAELLAARFAACGQCAPIDSTLYTKQFQKPMPCKQALHLRVA